MRDLSRVARAHGYSSRTSAVVWVRLLVGHRRMHERGGVITKHMTHPACCGTVSSLCVHRTGVGQVVGDRYGVGGSVAWYLIGWREVLHVGWT